MLALFLSQLVASAQQGWMLRNAGLPSSQDFYAVSVIDSQTIWISGGGALKTLVFRSTDAASSWIDANPYPDSTGVPTGECGNFGLAAINSLEAVVATTSGRIFRTVDGELTWTKVFDDSSVTTFFNDLEMFDAQTGYAFGDAPNGSSPPGLVKTTDGGWTWSVVNNNLPLG